MEIKIIAQLNEKDQFNEVVEELEKKGLVVTRQGATSDGTLVGRFAEMRGVLIYKKED